MGTAEDERPVDGAAPLVGVFASAPADDFARAHGLACFAALARPLADVALSIRDPQTSQVYARRVHLDVRDARKEGFLLALSVLPSVLQEVLASSGASLSSACEKTSAALDRFADADPSEQEFTRSFLASVFVVSTRDENPLAELSRLQQIQHAMQHGSAETAASSVASHCAAPRWFLPHTLKHFLLVGTPETSQQRCDELLRQMRSTYGEDACQLLRWSDAELQDKPAVDLWAEEREWSSLLERGVERARLEVLAKTQHAQQQSNEAAKLFGCASTIPPLLASISSTVVAPPQTTGFAPLLLGPASLAAISAPNAVTQLSPPQNGALPSSSSGEAAALLPSPALCASTSAWLQQFSTQQLAPWLERQLRQLHEQMVARRGIGRSFAFDLSLGVRKWLGAAATPLASQNSGGSGGAQNAGQIGGGGGGGGANPPAAAMQYATESAELQTRRLADLAALFGLHSLAHSLYHSLKKEQASDGAWAQQAGCLLGAATAAAAEQLQEVQQPLPIKLVEYCEAAVGNLLNGGLRPSSVLRVALKCADLLESREQPTRAANLLVRMTILVGNEALADALVGVALARASGALRRADSKRRASFYAVMAGHRFARAKLGELAVASYAPVVDTYRGWAQAEDHVLYLLASDAKDAALAAECATRLLTNCDRHTGDQQRKHWDLLGTALKKLPDGARQRVPAPVPVVRSQDVHVIRGAIPEERARQGTSREEEQEWRQLEQQAGSQVPQLVATKETDNAEMARTPLEEPWRLVFPVKNPLSTRIKMTRLRLEVVIDEKERRFVEQNDVELEGEEERPIEWAVPVRGEDAGKIMRAEAVEFGIFLDGEENAEEKMRIPLRIEPFVRLNRTQQQRQSKQYAADNRLQVVVSPTTWPKLAIALSSTNSVTKFAGQTTRQVIWIKNDGPEELDAIALSFPQDSETRISVIPFEVDTTTQSRRRLTKVGQTWRVLENGQTLGKDVTKCLELVLRAPEGDSENWRLPISIIYKTGSAARSGRLEIRGESRSLVRVEAKIIDLAERLFAVRVSNVADRTIAARLEVVGVRAKNSQVRPLDGQPQLVLDGGGRSGTLHVVISEDPNTKKTKTQPGHNSQSADESTLPFPRATQSPEDVQSENSGENSGCHLGVAWRVTMLDEETGHMAQLHGETFARVESRSEPNRSRDDGGVEIEVVEEKSTGADTLSIEGWYAATASLIVTNKSKQPREFWLRFEEESDVHVQRRVQRAARVEPGAKFVFTVKPSAPTPGPQTLPAAKLQWHGIPPVDLSTGTRDVPAIRLLFA